MSEDALPTLTEDLSCGEHAAEIKICGDAIRNVVISANKMLELHEKYDTAANSFYLHQLDNQCAEVSNWIERRKALIEDAADKGWLKAETIWY